MEEEAGKRNHGEGLREKESLRRNLGAEPWRRNPGGRGALAKKSCGRHLGGNWEPSVSMYEGSLKGNYGEAAWGRKHRGRNQGGCTIE